MLDLLNRKIRQMHAALAALKKDDLSSFKPIVISDGRRTGAFVDFTNAADEIELRNLADQLIANIASIKDHLKVWCAKNGAPFHGDALINANFAVAVVHDLWNINKHAELDKPPRSGIRPELKNLRTNLVLSVAAAGSSVTVTVDPRTSQLVTMTSGEGKPQLGLVADIVDENGNEVGAFESICAQAAEAWEAALAAAGVPIGSPRSPYWPTCERLHAPHPLPPLRKGRGR